jgi:hypothetical protein
MSATTNTAASLVLMTAGLVGETAWRLSAAQAGLVTS